ncbi:Type I restriction-modification system, DNA-methyltransferase subunit M [Microcystis aeruginosa NIES-2549]|uniref:Type I restriction-modification system, DNA-methyltransferase subunit M n=1 Tax=Microcystis aeruginosa NIES-2549 TaxID=1641812 RepID=A0A0F6RKU1_MICAE|nr:N-6 DNA methylase [Microcystis aeruginosa]AKE63763.1 Type I restriction-modification system, DNA-methyltransferase subunit M [Microcystis aeruginosa NIES-2549]AOC52150.1 Type I restriction-modification system, DNA-methyltransferase subunit M [Microcystis aeruginosa NIES-2481]
MSLIQEGIKKGLIKLDDEEKYITYINQNKKRNYSNPEEQVQAETFLKLVLTYGYAQKRIRLFVPVVMGSSTKEADIIVYNDDGHKSPHIVVECKKQEVSELEFTQAVEQGFSYAVAEGAKYVWITSGIKDEYYQVPTEKPKERITITDIPQSGVETLARFKYAKGGGISNGQKLFELTVVTEDELTRRFKQAHQSLWGGGELNPSEAFDELDKLIFCKIWDEKKARKVGEPYDFQIFSVAPKANEKEEERKQRENKQLSERIKALYEEGRRADAEVFKDDIRLSPEKLRTVVGYLESINLGETDLDSKGRAFETFMGSFFRGDFGQYFTPRPIVKFIVDVLPIKHNSLVLDTSCGSGGFLLHALEKVRREADEYYPNYQTDPKEYNKHYQHWHNFAQSNLFGIEINEQIARVAKMNMIIHDDGHTNVIAADGLRDSEDLIKRTENKGFTYNRFDFVITNPPFGSVIKQTEQAYISQYSFAMKAVDWLNPKSRTTERDSQSTEVLFLEQCHRFLKEGGYLAMVVPDGILTNSSLQYVREGIEEKYRIVAVVSMPQTAFSATGAGVKSSVLFLKKHSQAVTESIQQAKLALQDQIKQGNDYLKLLDKIENNKKRHLKELRGFDNAQNLSGKALTDSELYKEWKKSVTAEYNDQIEALKESLSDQYAEEKQKVIEDYPIFMAIAEDIGYDATGKPTNNNELDFIGRELARFIESIESAKDSFFLSLDVDKDKIFLVNLQGLEGRLDPHFYEPKFIENEIKLQKIGCTKLAHQSLSIFSGITPKSGGDAYCEMNVGIPFIRSGDFLENGNINFSELLYIKPDIHNGIMKGSQLKKNDLLIAIVGATIGKVGIYQDARDSNINQAIAAVRLKQNLKPEFVRAFLLTPIGQKVIDRIKRPVARANLNLEEVGSFLIPNFSISKQNKIILAMENAYAAKKQKELEAQQLLESIDDYLLGELGIELPEPEENTIQNRVFIRNLSEVSGDRFDSYYYKNIFELLKQSVLNGKYPINRLRDLSSDIQNGVEIRNYSNRGFRYLRVTDLGKYDINNNSPRYVDVTEIPSRIILNERCLLVSRSGSLGLISRVEPEIQNAILSSHIFKVELDINIIVPEYAEAFLRSKVGQLEIFRENNGGVIPEINQIALGKILIPFPPLEKQIEISEHITAIRNQAKQLQQQAKDDLEKAKQEVEAMILGDD